MLYDIVKITYDNGKYYFFPSKNVDMTIYSLKKAIKEKEASPNFYHELYAVNNNIKTFEVDIVENNVPVRQVHKHVNTFTKALGGMKLTKKEKDDIVIHSAINKLRNAFEQKSIFLTAKNILFLEEAIENMQGNVTIIKLITKLVYSMNSFAAFETLIIDLEKGELTKKSEEILAEL